MRLKLFTALYLAAKIACRVTRAAYFAANNFHDWSWRQCTRERMRASKRWAMRNLVS